MIKQIKPSVFLFPNINLTANKAQPVSSLWTLQSWVTLKTGSECWKKPRTPFLCGEAIPLCGQSLPGRALPWGSWQGWAVIAEGSKEAVTPTLQRGHSGLRCWWPGWMNGWLHPSVPAPSLPPSTQQASPLSPQGRWGRFARPQGRGNGVILPLGGLCHLWLKIFFPMHPQRNWRAFVNSLCHRGICLISCLSLEALYT